MDELEHTSLAYSMRTGSFATAGGWAEWRTVVRLVFALLFWDQQANSQGRGSPNFTVLLGIPFKEFVSLIVQNIVHVYIYLLLFPHPSLPLSPAQNLKIPVQYTLHKVQQYFTVLHNVLQGLLFLESHRLLLLCFHKQEDFSKSKARRPVRWHHGTDMLSNSKA